MGDTVTTWISGQETQMAATIPGVRAALPQERRADFDQDINAATFATIATVLGHWMLEAYPDPEADATMDRLAAEEAARANAA